MPSWFILVPFACVLVLNLAPKAWMSRFAFWLAAALTLAQLILAAGNRAIFQGAYADPLAKFFNFTLAIDGLSRLMLLSIAIVAFAALLTGRYSITTAAKRFNFTNLVLIALIGMNAVVMATDIFSLYVFLETSAISLFILIAASKDKLALEGAFKYLILSAIATVLILFSIALFVLFSGGTSFGLIHAALAEQGSAYLARLAVVLFLCGIFIKSGLVPFHGWLPDAYSSAATPVSVLLAGIVTKVTGVYVLMRLVTQVFVLDARAQNLLMFVGALSIIIGAYGALGQREFKRMLAYSSISQVGYIVLALGCGTPLAFAGAAFHLFNHAIFKSLLFVNACCLEKETGTLDIEKMSGLSQRMPVTAASSLVASLSTAGLPPLAGFWSKFIIILALMQAGKTTYAVVALLASVLTLGYFLILQRKVFFSKLGDGVSGVKEAGAGLVMLELFLTLITIGAGIAFPFVYSNLILPILSHQ